MKSYLPIILLLLSTPALAHPGARALKACLSEALADPQTEFPAHVQGTYGFECKGEAAQTLYSILNDFSQNDFKVIGAKFDKNSNKHVKSSEEASLEYRFLGSKLSHSPSFCTETKKMGKSEFSCSIHFDLHPRFTPLLSSNQNLLAKMRSCLLDRVDRPSRFGSLESFWSYNHEQKVGIPCEWGESSEAFYQELSATPQSPAFPSIRISLYPSYAPSMYLALFGQTEGGSSCREQSDHGTLKVACDINIDLDKTLVARWFNPNPYYVEIHSTELQDSPRPYARFTSRYLERNGIEQIEHGQIVYLLNDFPSQEVTPWNGEDRMKDKTPNLILPPKDDMSVKLWRLYSSYVEIYDPQGNRLEGSIYRNPNGKTFGTNELVDGDMNFTRFHVPTSSDQPLEIQVKGVANIRIWSP